MVRDFLSELQRARQTILEIDIGLESEDDEDKERAAGEDLEGGSAHERDTQHDADGWSQQERELKSQPSKVGLGGCWRVWV